ncbi:MAG: hypothetical protein WC488_00920 [Candidatus Micrarchaeia archaeon]
MPFGLITFQEELRIFTRVRDFYRRLYPKITFSEEERMLQHSDIGEVLYTYAGDETQPLAADRHAELEKYISRSHVPAIILKKGKTLILLDGHRRLRFAWRNRIPWKALMLVPGKGRKFAIEETVMGRIADMY